ncbi:MAG TPA: glycogen debranching enzyme, partial [Caldithrix abyssi]|nr:glycogen debranching enzyme [Caldithrix abyssi]
MEEQNNNRQKILSLVNTEFEIRPGKPYPFGANLVRGGINFAIYAPRARVLSLVVFDRCSTDVLMEFPLDARLNRTGDVWHAFIAGLDAGIRYGYRVICDADFKDPSPACKGEVILLDPYAKATCGGDTWGRPLKIERDGKEHTFRLSLIVDDYFDWGND